MIKFIFRLSVLIACLYPFMDDAASRANRKYDRLNGAQIQEAILTINHLRKPIHG